jgi:hypothetical protein
MTLLIFILLAIAIVGDAEREVTGVYRASWWQRRAWKRERLVIARPNRWRL